MKLSKLKTAIAALPLLGLLWLDHAVAAPPEKIAVTSANPDSALQGEALDVVIGGSGFGLGAAVKYFVTGTKDDSQISVLSVTYDATDGTLTTSIQVHGDASVSDYDIEVQAASGRRGKGTTLFKVQANSNAGGQNNLLTISCDELFGFAPGTCTAEGSSDPCMFEQPIDNDRAWQMTQDCDTHEMLIVAPDYPFLGGANYRLNLIAPWDGYAGIATSLGSSRISGFHIVVADPAVANGCGGLSTAQSAVYFDPDLQPTSGAPRGAVGQNIVEASNGARFCYGIEFVGSDPAISAPYKGTGADGNHIMANSYERVGIWAANINSQDTDTKRGEGANFFSNIVEASDSPCAIGMLLGNIERLVARDNLVYASSGAGCAEYTAGIVVLDSGRNKSSLLGPDYDFLEARPAELSGNAVQTGGNGSIGIVIDADTTAQTSDNQTTAGDAGDLGLCVETGADLTEVKKASRYIGFSAGNAIVFTGDCNAAIP